MTNFESLEKDAGSPLWFPPKTVRVHAKEGSATGVGIGSKPAMFQKLLFKLDHNDRI
jgi:hypothetical protein